MNKTLFICFFIFLSFSQSVFAAAIIPENDLKGPPIISKDFNNFSKHAFTQIIMRLHKIYAPIIEEKSGLRFDVIADWQDTTLNAYATRSVDSWNIHIKGGIARAKGMNEDVFALIICHEIGHHLGGAPRTFLYEGWPSAEGQADYFATTKCLKKYYAELEREESFAINANVVPEKVILDCNATYKDLSDLKICIRSQMAVLGFANFLNQLPDARKPITLETVDQRVVRGTNTNDYPRPQCRFDTLYQGSLCPIHSDVASSDTDAKIGYCNDESKPGTRPRCWYKP